MDRRTEKDKERLAGESETRRYRWLVASAVFLGICLAFALVSLRMRANRWTSAAIRERVLSAAPLGCSVSSVEAALRENRWHEGMCWVEGDNGTKTQIMFRYGQFFEFRRLPWPTVVEVHLSFNHQRTLSDISVR